MKGLLSALSRFSIGIQRFLANARARRWPVIAIQLIVAGAFTLLIAQFNLDYIEALTFDLRMRLRPSHSPSGHVELVLMDQRTVEAVGGLPGYRQYHQALEVILKQKPAAVVVVPALTRGGDVEDDKNILEASPEGPPSDAEALAKLVTDYPHFYQLTYKFKLAGQVEDYKLAPPFDNVRTLSFSKSADGTLFARDGVTRRTIVTYQEQPLGALYLAGLVTDHALTPEMIRGQFDVYDSRQVYIDYARPGTLSTTKMEQVIRADVPADRFTGKIVLIGEDFDKTMKSYVSTPYSRDPRSMTALELHGHALDTFIRNSAPIRAPDWIRLALIAIIAFLTIRIVLNEHPLKGLTDLLVMTGTFVISSYLIFCFSGLLIPMAHPLLAIFLCYYFFIPYRLIMENRRSWEYYQKNQLLKQVEELKTNFISMMSHDLKTPIARIQGMADVITKDTNQLSSPQLEAVDHIRSSSEDLHRFINSILNYARIESEGVQLHLHARDINEVVKEVVRKHDFLAKLKHITVETSLEPLFPIKVDPDLIRQVISNVVENAIKYSPEHSRVRVSTQEIEGFVRVQVEDSGQGIPADELPNIFMKFFRSKNAKSSAIKGSGLGLYLAKYFVELHKGQISAQSTPGKGSTFTVDLPLGN